MVIAQMVQSSSSIKLIEKQMIAIYTYKHLTHSLVIMTQKTNTYYKITVSDNCLIIMIP